LKTGVRTAVSVDNTVIGAKITEFRERKRLTVEQLAEKVGVPAERLAGWEAGNGSPRAGRLDVLEKILEVRLLDEASSSVGKLATNLIPHTPIPAVSDASPSKDIDGTISSLLSRLNAEILQLEERLANLQREKAALVAGWQTIQRARES
jgi:transcriptional regulator with XRE-family HTH domain